MSRSGYSEDYFGGDADDQRRANAYMGAVRSAFRGQRGQALLRDTLVALDAMPVKELIAESLVTIDGKFCTLGVLGQARGVPIETLDPEDPEQVAKAFNVAPCMVRQIVWRNDEMGDSHEPPSGRWARMRDWIEREIKQ